MTFFDLSALKHFKHICAHERTVEFLNTPQGDERTENCLTC